jgi:lipoprotein-anchoring transpeptidase ErfK/SrfK
MKHAIALGLLAPLAAVAQPATAPKPAIDMQVLHVQVILDKLGFGPGVLDGRGGQSLVAAIKGFEESRGLRVTGKAEGATLQALAAYKAWEPVKTLRLGEGALRGPFTSPFPKDPVEQAKLSGLNYRNALEALAERFHTTPQVLVALNPGGRLEAGQWLKFPNVLPTSRAYEVSDETWKTTLGALNVSANTAKAGSIVVDKSEGVLKAFDPDGKLIAQYSATIGSARDPLPLGTWTVKGTAYNPTWSYNPSILKTADKSDPKVDVPPGPNSPVGVVWIDLSKPHYGIHGTNEPQQIGRAESNGCIRLTNWDAARVALMVVPGTKVVFRA